MTNYARVTKAGAVRLMRPELEGQTVTYERLHDVCYVALNVTLDGQPVSTAMSYKERTDDDLPSLSLMGWRCGYCSSPHDGPSRGYCSQKCADRERAFLESDEHIHPNERSITKSRLKRFDAAIEEE